MFFVWSGNFTGIKRKYCLTLPDCHGLDFFICHIFNRLQILAESTYQRKQTLYQFIQSIEITSLLNLSINLLIRFLISNIK